MRDAVSLIELLQNVQCQVILGSEGLFDLIYRGALEEVI